MIQFSTEFVSDVKECFGSQVSPLLLEWMEEGDHERVESFLRNSIVKPTWDLFRTANYLELKVMADREARLRKLISRCRVEAGVDFTRDMHGVCAN